MKNKEVLSFSMDKMLIESALSCLDRSYAPYSGFNVAACVLSGSGRIYTGVNVENASYPAGICAECSAISAAISSGETSIIKIAVVGGKNKIASDYCAPCGICRQVMREFCDPSEFKVLMARSASDYKEMTLESLLPLSFGPESLR